MKIYSSIFLVILFAFLLSGCDAASRGEFIEDATSQIGIEFEASGDDFVSCVTTNLVPFVGNSSHWPLLVEPVGQLLGGFNPFSPLHRTVRDVLETPETLNEDLLDAATEIVMEVLRPQPISGLTPVILCDAIHNNHSVSFQPYIIPIQISLDQNGVFGLEAEAAIPTPVGIVEISSEADLVELFPDKRLLTILMDDEIVSVYEIEQDVEYSIAFDYEDTVLNFVAYRQDANDNIFLEFRTVAD